MAYALLDHPDLGDRHTSAMMAEILSLRFETSAPDSLFLALFLRRLPSSIRDHLAAANHTTATEMAAHADILWDARSTAGFSLSPIPSPPFLLAPLRLGPAVPPTATPYLLTAAPGPQIATATTSASRAAAKHQDARTAEPARNCVYITVISASRPRSARAHATGRKTRSLPWAAQCSRRPHLSSGFGFQQFQQFLVRHRCAVSSQVVSCLFRSPIVWG
jgi:hypothetical protein